MKTKRVLVADEHASSRELLRILLEHQGCEVSEASDGAQAVAMARATLPDLVLLDLDLTDVDAYSAVRLMRRDSRLRSRSIVALTGKMQSSEGDQLQQAGFTGYITKPVILRSFSLLLAQYLSAQPER